MTKDYVVTGGVVPLIQNRLGIKLLNGSVPKIRELEKKFASELSDIVAREKENYRFTFISDEEIIETNKDMLAKARNPIVSFDDVYGVDANFFFSTTRITNPKDMDDYKIFERPGAKPLETQRKELAKKYAGKTIDLYDVGIFSGDTLKDEVTENFHRLGINVGTIYLSVANERKIEQFSDIADVKVVKEFNFGEWLESRDPLIFDGRKVARIPKYGEDNIGDQLFIPYTEVPDKLASISHENAPAYVELSTRYHNMICEALAECGYRINKQTYSNDGEASVLRLSIK